MQEIVRNKEQHFFKYNCMKTLFMCIAALKIQMRKTSTNLAKDIRMNFIIERLGQFSWPPNGKLLKKTVIKKIISQPNDRR